MAKGADEASGGLEGISEQVMFREATDTTGKLSGIVNLLRRSWDIYKKRAVTLISIMLISGILAAVLGAVFLGLFFLSFFAFTPISIPLIKMLGILSGVACSMTVITGILAVNFAAADASLNIGHAFAKGCRNLFSGIWMIFLQGFIVTGGVLLFLLPGILFLVWFIFALCIFASSDERRWWTKNWTDRGMDALIKSKEYVRGYWFEVFFRLFMIWIIWGGISMIPVVGLVFAFLLVPFAVIYHYLIYQDLRALKGDVYYPSSAWEKGKWIGAGILGYTVMTVTISLLCY